MTWSRMINRAADKSLHGEGIALFSISPGFASVKSRTYNRSIHNRNQWERIHNAVTWVHDRIFAAGGGHVPSTWESFRLQTGIRVVLNIDPSSPTQLSGAPPDRFLWINASDENEANIEARLLAGRFIFDAIQSGHRVLLHSNQGRHRTRWAYVAFLLCYGKTVTTALRQAAETPWLAPYETDREQWRVLVERLKSSSIEPTA